MRAFFRNITYKGTRTALAVARRRSMYRIVDDSYTEPIIPVRSGIGTCRAMPILTDDG